VKDDEGTTNTTEKKITIIDFKPDQIRPIVNANGPNFSIVNKTVYFNSSGTYDPDGYITIYYWDFGDYNYSFEQNPNHTYSKPGRYTIRLIVQDNDNLTSASFISITIDEEEEEIKTEKIKEEETNYWWILLLIIIFIFFIIIILIKRGILKKIKKPSIKINKVKDVKKASNISKKISKTKDNYTFKVPVKKEEIDKITDTQKITKPKLLLKEADILTPIKHPIEKGTPVLMHETNKVIGNIKDVIYNDNNNITVIRVKYITSKEVANFPIDLFDFKDNNLVFKSNHFNKNIKSNNNLETKGQRIQEFTKQHELDKITNNEIDRSFVTHDKENATLSEEEVEQNEDVVLLKDSLEKKLVLLKKQYILLNDKLELIEYKPLATRDKLDDLMIKDIKEKMKRVDSYIRKCEELLKQFKITPF